MQRGLPLWWLLKFLNTLKHCRGIFVSYNLIYLAFAVGYAIVPYMGVAFTAFSSNNFFDFINVLNVDKVKATAHIGNFYKNRFHRVKVVKQEGGITKKSPAMRRIL